MTDAAGLGGGRPDLTTTNSAETLRTDVPLVKQSDRELIAIPCEIKLVEPLLSSIGRRAGIVGAG